MSNGDTDPDYWDNLANPDSDIYDPDYDPDANSNWIDEDRENTREQREREEEEWREREREDWQDSHERICFPVSCEIMFEEEGWCAISCYEECSYEGKYYHWLTKIYEVDCEGGSL